MSDDEQPEASEVVDEPTEPADPIRTIQDALATVYGEGSLCSGFALVTEWLEEDGGTSFQVFSTPMPPWHLQGLLGYALDAMKVDYVPIVLDDAEDDDDF